VGAARRKRETGNRETRPDEAGLERSLGDRSGRESERDIVLMKPGNSGGGKVPCFRYAFEEGEGREIGVSLTTPEKLGSLQKKLYDKAKAEPAYRFYMLYDKIYRSDILAHAYALCREDDGAPGVDGKRFEDIEAQGVERWLADLGRDLAAKTYHPEAVRRVLIPDPLP
jgi:RNA-directed DNA polymerase